MADDHELWERICSRDANVFEAFYRDNAVRLCAYLRQIVGNAQAAEDVMQETFTQIWRSPNGFRPELGTLRGYLFGIARKRAAEWWRKRTRAPEVQGEKREEESEEVAASFSAIGDAFARLGEEQRSLLWLREVEGQSYAELAEILQVPVGTVKSRLADRGTDSCAFFGGNLPGELAVSTRFIRKEGENVQLGVKTHFTSAAAMRRSYTNTFELKMFDEIPEQEYWIDPDRKLSVAVADFGTVEVSGQFLDHMPVMASNPREALDPGEAEFRILSPVLICDKQVLVNMSGASATPGEKDSGVTLYIPGEGLFVLSPVPFEGGTEVVVRNGSNQVEFTAGGKPYVLVTGAPRGEHVWVRHLPNWRPSNNPGWFLGSVNIRSLRKFLETEMQ